MARLPAFLQTRYSICWRFSPLRPCFVFLTSIFNFHPLFLHLALSDFAVLGLASGLLSSRLHLVVYCGHSEVASHYMTEEISKQASTWSSPTAAHNFILNVWIKSFFLCGDRYGSSRLALDNRHHLHNNLSSTITWSGHSAV